MEDPDLESLRALLRDAVAGSRLSIRTVEAALGIGNGTLHRLLQGQGELRVRHILALARLLRVSPADFLHLGCPDTVRTAENDLADWLSPPLRRTLEEKAAKRQGRKGD